MQYASVACSYVHHEKKAKHFGSDHCPFQQGALNSLIYVICQFSNKYLYDAAAAAAFSYLHLIQLMQFPASRSVTVDHITFKRITIKDICVAFATVRKQRIKHAVHNYVGQYTRDGNDLYLWQMEKQRQKHNKSSRKCFYIRQKKKIFSITSTMSWVEFYWIYRYLWIIQQYCDDYYYHYDSMIDGHFFHFWIALKFKVKRKRSNWPRKI